ncbi:hypothetical protein B0T17DRAFT_493995, partial [Bombardia bombarda]
MQLTDELTDRPSRTDLQTVLTRLEELGIAQSDLGKAAKSLNQKLEVESETIGKHLEELRSLVSSPEAAINKELVLQSLYLPILNERYGDVAEAEPTTFEWIFKTTTFCEWLKSGSGVFHISGKPGAGKSTLMKFLCNHTRSEELLKTWAGSNMLVVAKFFFWKFGVNNQQKNLFGLRRHLLYEVLKSIPQLIQKVLGKFWNPPVFAKTGRLPDIDMKDIQDAFKLLVTDSTLFNGLSQDLRACFFIDGLDEFDDSGTNPTHGRLVKNILEWTQASSSRIKICVSSRELPPFTDMLDPQQRLRLHTLTKMDIRRLVESRLLRHPRFGVLQGLDEWRCTQLITRLTKRAEGVFLWVALVLKQIERG